MPIDQKRCALSLSTLLLTVAFVGKIAIAHPPVALVMDHQGTVFYSDLHHVWMIAPDGAKTIAVRNVHTHELWLGPDGSLYGEDVTNVGEQWYHRVWRRHPDGALTDVIPRRAGHPVDHADYAFAHDQSGRSYVLRRAEGRIDIRREGAVVRSVPLDLRRGTPGWLIADSTGVVHVTVGPDLLRLEPSDDALTVVARDLVERTEAFDFVHDRHALMGLWTDREGAVFVAVFAGQMVKRITPAGTVSVVARTKGSWSPSGGLVAPDGALWLLEFSTSNEARVRRIGPDGGEQIF